MNLSTLNPQQIYKLFTGAVVPRPIAWVATISEDGIPNLAPFSYFNIVSINPPLLSFSPLNAPTEDGSVRKKDTLNNLEATHECVIHIVSYEMTEAMSQTSGNFAPHISEFEAVHLAHIPSDMVNVPRLKEAKIAFEAKLHQIIRFGDAPLGGNLCIVEILKAHFAQGIEQDFKIDIEALDPVARLGGDWYNRTKESRFEIKR